MHWLSKGEEPPKFQIIGHRGAAGLAPENTLSSFRTALALGCPMLELDVHVAHDEHTKPHLMVIHDPTLQRTTNGTGKVAAHSVEQLKQLRSAGEPLPLLTDVLDLMASQPHDAALNIELKGSGSGVVTAELVASTPPAVPLLISSFDIKELEAFRRIDRNSAVALLLHQWDTRWSSLASTLAAMAVNLNNRIVTRRRVEEIRSAGLLCFVYTVNSARRAERLRSWGVNGVFTDRPDRMRHFLFPP